jgi:hypothetical protein
VDRCDLSRGSRNPKEWRESLPDFGALHHEPIRNFRLFFQQRLKPSGGVVPKLNPFPQKIDCVKAKGLSKQLVQIFGDTRIEQKQRLVRTARESE